MWQDRGDYSMLLVLPMIPINKKVTLTAYTVSVVHIKINHTSLSSIYFFYFTKTYSFR